MTGMDPEQLRLTIVRAAIPLIGEYDTLTTAKIARAAGIGEADLLAVFADKEAVMQACIAAMTEALRVAIEPAEDLRELAAIRADQPLASRLVKVIDILDAYYRRLRIDLDDVLEAYAPAAGTTDTRGLRPPVPPDEVRAIGNSPELRQAVAKVLEPDEQRLRLPAQILAKAFVGMTFGGIRPAGPDQPPLPAEQVVDLFLHGALNTG
jgi:AcrR family transcriptional regulator